MASSPLQPFLSGDGFVVLDGGLATELEEKGADLRDHLWSARLLEDNPSLLLDTHLAYFRAGADVATTASYQASFEGFQRKGFDHEKATDLLLLSVKLAVQARDQFWREYQQHQHHHHHHHQGGHSPQTASRHEESATEEFKTTPKDSDSGTIKRGRLEEVVTTATSTTAGASDASEATPPMPPLTLRHGARSQVSEVRRGKNDRRLRPLVAASVGSYGAALADGSEYRGDYGDSVGERRLREWHRERLDVLAGADGVEFLLFETIPCLAEVRAILFLLQDLHPKVSAVVCVSCKDSEHLRSGERLQDFADLIWQPSSGGGDGGEEALTTPAGVIGVGLNCTAPGHVSGALRVLSAVAQASSPRQASATTIVNTRLDAADKSSAAGQHAGQNPSAAVSTAPAPNSSCGKTAPGFVALSEDAGPGEAPESPIALVAYPNSGEEWDAIARDWAEGTGLRGRGSTSGGVEEFGRMVRDEWRAAGASVVGGCCRTRPAHIAEIRRVLLAGAVPSSPR